MLTFVKRSLSAAAVLLGAVTMAAPVHADGMMTTPLPVNQVSGSLSVMVLGSGGPMAFTGGRASAGYLIFTDGTPRIIMDAGGGTFKSLAESGANIHTVQFFLLSHMHIDHQGEVPALTKTLYFHARQAGVLRTAPIHYVGPGTNGVTFPSPPFPAGVLQYPATSTYINGLFAIPNGIDRYVHIFATAIHGGTFNYDVTDVPTPPPPKMGGQSITTVYSGPNGLVIKAIPVVHGPCPAVAYRISYKGHTIVYSGDTDSQSDNMVKIAQGADMLIYDTSITDTLPNTYPSDAVFFKLHTTPTRMGQVAAAAGVHKLVLSHLTPITAPRLPLVESLIREAGYAGDISVAHDLRVYNLDDTDD